MAVNILITGGTGFIGSQLALRCLERGDLVRVLGQENNPAESEARAMLEASGVEVVLAPITDEERMLEAAQGMDVVYHLAAAQHEANIPDARFWEVNVTGTRTMLEASVQAGVKRFVYGSTIGVYGSALDGLLDEDSPLKPNNIYGVTKLEAEKLALSYADRLPVVAIRISETYGPGDRRLLKLFSAIKKNRFLVIGNGKNLHHPIYVDDLIQGMFQATESEEAVGKVFILAGKEAVTTKEMAETIATQYGAKIPGLHAPLLPFVASATVMARTLGPLGIQPPIHPRRMDFFRTSFVFSGEKAAQTLGFVPQYGFREGVRKTAEWYSKMGYIEMPGAKNTMVTSDKPTTSKNGTSLTRQYQLTAKMEPFDSFWEGPEDLEKGYKTLGQFYRANYFQHLPREKDASILVISCGPGYFVNALVQQGYSNVLGIDSDPHKVEHALERGLNCRAAEAFPFLAEHPQQFDLVFCESEINHLTKDEILEFLALARASLKENGSIIFHSMNGANPITGAEGLALNFDHYNTFTDYSMRQILAYSHFEDIKVIPLKLYVFYKNPLNYVGLAVDTVFTLFFRLSFMFYGKSNRIFTKKIAAVARKGAG